MRLPSGSDWGQWASDLSALERAESEADWRAALAIRRRIIALRLHQRITGGLIAASDLDYALLDTFGTQLEDLELHEDALTVFHAARGYAESSGDRYGAAHFDLRGVHCCLALLDFDAAETVLQRVLGCVVAEDSGALARAAALAPPAASDGDLRVLRLEALVALGRYWAARGALGSADRAFGAALAAEHAVSLGSLSLKDVALLLAEVRLDRGDLAAFDELAARHDPSPGSREHWSWQVLQAGASLLRGALSAAEQGLLRIQSAPPGRVDLRLTRIAAWQRFHVLCFLNRLDEAFALLEEAARSAALPEEWVEMGHELLAARRSPDLIAFSMPPTPRETLGGAKSWDDDSPSAGPSAVSWAPAGRTRERIRDQWGVLANAVLAELHRGNTRRAAELAGELELWTSTIESPMLAVRSKHVLALVAATSGGAGACELAANAAAGFARLGLPLDELSACRILATALEREGRDDEARRTHARTQGLIERLRANLVGADRVLFFLNKASSVDRALGKLCEELRTATSAAPGRHARSARRARLRTTERILLLKRWELDRAPESERSEPFELSASDIFGWAQEQIRTRDAAVRDGMPIQRLHPRWLDDRTALVVYVVLPWRVEVILVSREEVRMLALATVIQRPELWQQVRRAITHLQYSERWNPDGQHLRALSAALGIEEIASALPPSVRRLAIVPDGILAHVPFSALPLAGAPFVARFEVTVMLRANWLLGARDPFRGRSLSVAIEESADEDGLAPLLHAHEEALAVAGSGFSQSSVLHGGNASRSQVIDNLRSVRCVHFACHGEFRAAEPHRSGLRMSDGWLTVGDLAHAEARELTLVYLSSCWSGNLLVLPGGEPVGLPTAFLDRGARWVVSSLWKVSDASSPEFARRFYATARTRGPVAALAEVQRDSLCELPPRVWAGFTAYSRGLDVRRSRRCFLWPRVLARRWSRR